MRTRDVDLANPGPARRPGDARPEQLRPQFPAIPRRACSYEFDSLLPVAVRRTGVTGTAASVACRRPR